MTPGAIVLKNQPSYRQRNDYLVNCIFKRLLDFFCPISNLIEGNPSSEKQTQRQ